MSGVDFVAASAWWHTEALMATKFPSLQAFIFRAQVFSLYRKFARETRALQPAQRGASDRASAPGERRRGLAIGLRASATSSTITACTATP